MYAQCAGGNKCGCNAHPHKHHICRNVDCVCHTAAAYGDELAQGRLGYVYVPAGALLREAKEVEA